MPENTTHLARKSTINLTRYNLHIINLKRFHHYASILGLRITIPNLDEVKRAEEAFITERLCRLEASDAYLQGRVELAKLGRTDNDVVISRRKIPKVSYLHVFQFIVWSVWLVIVQACADFWEGRPFRGVLATDAWAHYYVRIMNKIQSSLLTLISTFP